MTNQQHHHLFALLVEVVAKDLELNDEFWAGYRALLTNIVTESGGSMDDKEFVDAVADNLDSIINKNAVERRAYLQTQAA